MSHVSSPLSERAKGRWRGILSELGVSREVLTGKHGPCPICQGGKDRFRWTDHNGSGAWICNVCGHGTGTDLVMRLFGLDFKEAAKRIEGVIGAAEPEMRKERSDEDLRRAMAKLWNAGQRLTADCVAARYLAGRGIRIETFPGALRWAAAVRYGDDAVFPALLAQVIAPDGRAVNVHRTFLAEGGKAPVAEPRKLMKGAMPVGSSIRLAPVAPVMGIAEGIETAMSASLLFRVPVWSALNANNLAGFRPPRGVETLLIFGDNDASHTGQAAAHTLARECVCRWKVEAKVMIPPTQGTDWNDELQRRQCADAAE
jgi:putative DNA primase/helicase